MCGICCYIGYKDGFDYAFYGIQMLLNRGYDGLGACSLTREGKLVVSKYAKGVDGDIVKQLGSQQDIHKNCCVSILHSRWTTTGSSGLQCNVHPHIDYRGRFALVHNGTIENYEVLKNELVTKKGVVFKSQTDTEVVVNLISVYYDEFGSVEKAIAEAINRLEGTWGLVVISTENPDKMYCARHGSPLLIGFGDDFMMVASEQSGFYKYVNNYICLNDNDIVVLEKKGGKIEFTKKHEYALRPITVTDAKLTPDPFAHWTIREINEQTEAALRALGLGGRIVDDATVKLGGLEAYEKNLRDVNHLVLLGCGTSYNACTYSSRMFKEMSGFETVQVFDAADFTKYDVAKTGKTALVFVSQSGETRDLHRCVEVGRDMSLYMIGVVNSVDSLIAREVHCGVYLNAGREVGVASTKSFTSQVIVLNLIAVWFAQIRGLGETKRKTVIGDLRRLPFDIKGVIGEMLRVGGSGGGAGSGVGAGVGSGEESIAKRVAKYLLGQDNLFILGKFCCEAAAKEGALKIKEIGYLHTEGYNTSALKHGTYALINKGTPIILIMPDDESFGRNQNTIEEVKSREAFVVSISDKSLGDSVKSDVKITVPGNKTFSSLLAVIPLQLIAYELALLKGHNPDFPKHLAKCVTTD